VYCSNILIFVLGHYGRQWFASRSCRITPEKQHSVPVQDEARWTLHRRSGRVAKKKIPGPAWKKPTKGWS